MYDYYQLVSLTQTTNDLLRDNNDYLESIDLKLDNLTVLINLLLVISVLLAGYIVHHIVDAVWKR